MIENDLKISKHDQEAAFKDALHDHVDLRPILIMFSGGEDVTSIIDQVTSEFEFDLITIALGSQESITSAESILNSVTKANTWVHLENIHLASNWLNRLESRLQRLHFGNNSKVIITSKMDYTLPISLLRSCRLVMIEETQGMKVNMEYNLSLCQPYKGPKEFGRITFFICWIHTIILERSKYLPIGWTSNYSFSDSDLLLALQITGDWIKKFAAGRSNISPDLIPWKAIRALIGGIYGDKMDKNTDVMILESMIKYFLKPEIFNETCKINFPLGEGFDDILVPKGTDYDNFKSWLSQLNRESLNLIGFEEDMKIVVNLKKGIVL